MTNGLLRAHSGNQTLSPWDPESLRALRQALLAVSTSLSDLLTAPLQDRLWAQRTTVFTQVLQPWFCRPWGAASARAPPSRAQGAHTRERARTHFTTERVCEGGGHTHGERHGEETGALPSELTPQNMIRATGFRSGSGATALPDHHSPREGHTPESSFWLGLIPCVFLTNLVVAGFLGQK